MRFRKNFGGIDVFSVNQSKNNDTLMALVKPIDKWVMDAIKRERMAKFFFAMI